MASYAKPIADAVVTILQGLSGAPSLTEFRKDDVLKPQRAGTGDSLPACIVTVGEERLTGRIFGDAVFKEYTVGVTIYRSNLGDVESNLDTNPDFVLRAKQALDRTTLSGASVVWDVDLVDNSEWERQEFAKGIEVSKFGLIVRTNEPRNG